MVSTCLNRFLYKRGIGLYISFLTQLFTMPKLYVLSISDLHINKYSIVHFITHGWVCLSGGWIRGNVYNALKCMTL